MESEINLGPGIGRTPLPLGFTTSGINSGVRKYRPDLGLIYSEMPTNTVGVFTKNNLKAAPILYCQSLLPSNSIRAIITNSGQANAATGKVGELNNKKMVNEIAKEIGCLPEQILTASTGVIGQHLSIDKITAGIPELFFRRNDSAEAFALAILTTDLVPKTVSAELNLSGGKVRITGICKGSGMIHPNMGTMLGYILTDAEIPLEIGQTLLQKATDVSFNMISVDGDCSTNDCVFLMANGSSKVKLLTSEDHALFEKLTILVMQKLAKAIARDGEGATKLIEVQIEGAPEIQLAKKAARSITLSPLVKTALHGEDPNWGRIVARLGAEDLPLKCIEQMMVKIQDTLVFQNGLPAEFDRTSLKEKLRKDTIKIDVNFFSGKISTTAWGCDLSKKYVEINTEYS